MTFSGNVPALFTLVAALLSVKIQPVSGQHRLGSPYKNVPGESKYYELEDELEQEQRTLQATLPGLPLLADDGNPSSVYPLGLCEGDCDKDTDCQAGFKCFHWELGDDPAIPGCSGQAIEAKDYCYNPYEDPANQLPGFLAYVGNDNAPNGVFPLGRCQGDCDDDDQCQEGLKCFLRAGNETIPGCEGTGTITKDYCYQPEAEADFTGSSPTATQEPSPAPTISSGTTIYYPGTLDFRGESTDDIERAKWFPLAVCEGDCDSDSECLPGLLCYKRWDFRPVPGCSGTGIRGMDYCYNPLMLSATTAPDVLNPTEAPLASMPSPSPSALPTTSPTVPTVAPTSNPSASLHPSSEPSANPTDAATIPPLDYVGNNGEPNNQGDTNPFPLGRCQGDCDDDDECQEGLTCFHRDGDEPVPGCEGTGVSVKDYCYQAPGVGRN